MTPGTSRPFGFGIIRLLLLVVALLLVVSSLVSLVSHASAQSTETPEADYYNNSSTVVGNATWMDGRQNATLDNTTNFLTRIGTFVIGSGGVSSSSAATGTLLTGLLVGVVVVGITGGSSVGIVAGSVLGMGSVAVLVETGFAPGWLYLVLLMIVGLIGTPVLIRLFK